MLSYHGQHSKKIVQRWLPDDLYSRVYLNAYHDQGQAGQYPNNNHERQASVLVPSGLYREIVHEATVNLKLASLGLNRVRLIGSQEISKRVHVSQEQPSSVRTYINCSEIFA